MTASTLTSWARAIRRALDDAGIDATTLFAQAGLDPALLADPDARYPLERTTRLWRLAVEATGDPGFGLVVAGKVGPTTFQALGYAVAASATLREAFERIVRYFRVVTDVVELGFEARADACEFRIATRAGLADPAPEATDAFVSLLVRTCRSLGGRALAPRRIRLRRRAPADPARYQALLRAPLEFDADENLLVFATADLERRLEGANVELARHNDAIVQRQLARLQHDDLRARVRAVLVERLPEGAPGAADVAAALLCSVRTLQRRLAEDGTRYDELLDRTRRELALSYLAGPRHAVIEIAFLLGYADASSFTRAFRRWTGTSPTRHRALAMHAPPAATRARLEQAYRATRYEIDTTPGPIDLRVGVPSAPLRALHEARGVQGSSFLTAWNPRSTPLPEARNLVRQEALKRELEQGGYAWIEGRGVGADATWAPEPSVLVLGVSEPDAIALGRRHGQHAILWIGRDATPRLVWLDD